MDYQALFEAGTLTPQQLFEWMQVDRNTAAAALKQRPELQKGLMEVLSRNSTSPSAEQNQPQSAWSQAKQKSDEYYGAEEDDGFVEGVGKGLLDVLPAANRVGLAGADYLKAGFNELTGNEEGLQWEDTPDLKDVGSDVFSTALAAVTGGTGPGVLKEIGKKTFQNLTKGGFKNIPKNIAPTAGKIKNKIGNTATGKAAKVALGGPKRKAAAALGVAGGLNALNNQAPEAEQDITNTAPQEPQKPLDKVDLDTPIAERGPNGEVADPAANQNLDNPNGQMAMTPEGKAQAAMQAKANSMPDMVNRLGGSGSKMGNLAKGRVQAQANFMADDIIKAQKIQARKDASKAHREGVMADNWETSQTGRESGKAWDELDDDTRQDMQKRFMANLGSPYDSAQDAKQARLDKVINEFGGNYVSPDGETGAPGQLTKEQFMDKTGMRTEGTGITQNADGSYNTLEFGDTFENSGGMDSAEDYLIGSEQQGPVQPESSRIPDGQGGYSQPDPLLNPDASAQQNQQRPFNPVEGGASMMANLQNFGPGSGSSTPNNSGKGMYTDQFGQQSELGEGTVRMSANDEEYGDANFKNKKDALGYLNRGASLDEPAPEAPEAPEAPKEEGGWDKYAPYLAPLALLHPTTRKMGQKMMPKFKKNMKQLGDDFYEATPIPRFPGQAPRLSNNPMPLPNRAPGLPHRAPGLPHRADPNKSISAPAGRQATSDQFRIGQRMSPSERNAYRESQKDIFGRDQVTPEQFRRAQTGMGPSERASAVGAKEAQERAVVDRMRQLNRKAQLEREARARRLAGQPMNPNPYGVPASQYHMNGQLAAKRPPFPN